MKSIKTLSTAGLSVFVTLALASGGMAADFAPPPILKYPDRVFQWTGAYIGGSVGSGWGTNQTDLAVGNTFVGAPVNQTVNQLAGGNVDFNVPLPQVQLNGFIGGIQAGYNFQSGIILYGFEGDFLWSGIKGRSDCFVVVNCTYENKWIADITGRVGVIVGDRGLLYLKGGAAWAHSSIGINQSIAIASSSGAGFSATGAINGGTTQTIFGGTLGAGVEYAFIPGWSAKLEYDYFDFGKRDVALPVSITDRVQTGGDGPTGALDAVVRPALSVKQQFHTIRLGVNYHF
ncbi:outer membrane protein [Bradyrhizobium sp. SBR1B]|uniref:outer membrane protein n=1 Tax=Bradyrhizobium sp. SBR1B TaxID=2663836 RepID=UPI0016065358|nr:outer membrane beta-barrel protein [Bradyrhizobium sp. SBR1B]MBB4380275.1 outer membrane immunogenic protein [Bradyrhizobium sp. SBR1B]